MFQPLRLLAFALALFIAPAWAALDPASVLPLADEDPDVRIEAIRKLTATQEPRVADILGALSNEALGLVDNGRRAVIVTDGQMTDAVTGAPLGAAPANFEALMVNNRLRGEIDAALAALKLASPDAAARLAAAKSLQGSDNEGLLPIVQQALDKEADAEVQRRAGARRPRRSR